MQKLLASILIGLCCFAGCNSRPDAPEVDVPYDAKFPRAMELRIVAGERHRTIIDWARKQQAQETDEKMPWTDLVVTPEAKNPVARWVDVESQAAEILKADARNTMRSIPGETRKSQILVILDPYNVTSDYVKRARPGVDDQGKIAVFFELTRNGAERFEKLTGSNLPQNAEYLQMGIIVNNLLYSAPRIVNVISDSGQITGNFTEAEAKQIAELMTAKSGPTK